MEKEKELIPKKLHKPKPSPSIITCQNRAPILLLKE